MLLMRWFSILMFSFLLTACGGGGSIEKPEGELGNGSGSSSNDYELTVSIANQGSELSIATPLTVEALFKDGDDPVANTRIEFTADEFSRFSSPSSALTNSQGIATVILAPTDVKGAGVIRASVSIAENTFQGSVDYTSLGDGGLQLSAVVVDQNGQAITEQNPLSRTTTGVVQTTLLFDGEPLPNQLISYTLDSIAASQGSDKASTNALGVAQFPITATKQTGTGEISVNYSDKEISVTFVSAGNVYFNEDIYELTLTGTDANTQQATNNLSVATPINLEALLTFNGDPLPNQVISFSADSKAKISDTSITTDANGKANITLKATEVSGEGSVNASFTSSNRTINSEYDFDSKGDGGVQFTVSITDSAGNPITDENRISRSRPAKVTVTVVKDQVIQSGAIVTIDPGSFASMNETRKQTNSEGQAEFTVFANAFVGLVSLDIGYEDAGASNVTKTYNFYSAGDGGVQLNVLIQDSSGDVINESNPMSADKKAYAFVTVTSDNLPLKGAFVSVDPGVHGVSDSQIRETNGLGQARFEITPTKESGTGILTARYQLTDTRTVTQTASYFSTGDEFFGETIYEVNITLTDENSGQPSRALAEGTPLIATAQLLLNDKAVAGEALEFTVDKARLDSLTSTIITNEQGIAQVRLLDKGEDGTGSVSVSFAEAQKQDSESFTAAGDGGESLVINVDIRDKDGNIISPDNEIAENKDGMVTLTLLEGETPLASKFINVDVGDKAVTVPRDGLVVTDANGQARITIQANIEKGAANLRAVYTQEDGTEITGTAPYYTDGNPNFDANPYKFVFTAKRASDGVTSNQLSGAEPLILEAQLLNLETPIQNTVVKFSVDQYARLADGSESVLTNTNGVASVTLLDNDIRGAGRVTVTYVQPDGNDLTETLDFNSQGDGGISLSISDVVEANNPDNIITSDYRINGERNGLVTVTLLENGQPLKGQLVTVESNSLATLDPVNGRILTDSNGEAQFTLIATTEAGLGQFTVTYRQSETLEFTETGFFYSASNPKDESGLYNIDIKLLTNCQEGWDSDRDNAGVNLSQCTEANRISSNELVDIYVRVSSKASENTVLDNEIVDVSSSIGQILPSSGKALTDSQGVALLKLQPSDTGGAGTVIASFDGENSESNFSVGVVDLVLTIDNGLTLKDDNSGDYMPLSAGGSTILRVEIKDEEDNIYLTRTDVNFSSLCVASGEAEIDELVKSNDGIATSTYRAKGCSITDQITVTVEAGGNTYVETIDLPVSSAPAQALKFLSASEEFIALPPGEGGAPTLSVIEFELLDTDTNPLKQKTIDFRLTDSTGAASLTQTRSSTDNEGKVQTTVTSGIVPGPLVVQACYIPDELLESAQEYNNNNEGANRTVSCWADVAERCTDGDARDDCVVFVPIAEQISGVSSRVLLSSGVTDQDSFDAGPDNYNPNAFRYLGATVDITVYFGDQFNHLSGDGVTATIEPETGVVGTFDGEQFNELYNCQSTDASCTLTWRRQGDIPFSGSEWQNQIDDVCDDYFDAPAPCIGKYPTKIGGRTIMQAGRVNFLVTAKGQETFVDKQSSGGVERRNGQFDEGEYHSSFDLPEAFLDINQDGSYNGELCREGDANDPCAPNSSNGGHNETYRDLNNNGLYDPADGIYNGLLCSEAAEAGGFCSRDLIEVRKRFSFSISDDTPHVRFAAPKEQFVGTDAAYTLPDNCDSSDVAWNMHRLEPSDETNIPDWPEFCDIQTVTVGDSGLERMQIYIFYSDINGNPLPSGTEVTITTDNGDLAINRLETTVGQQYGGKSEETNYAIITIKEEDESNGTDAGNITIEFTFTTPSGEEKVERATLTVLDPEPEPEG